VRAEDDRGIEGLAGLTDDDPLQDEVLIARERLARVREGLACLPEKTRTIFSGIASRRSTSSPIWEGCSVNLL